MTVMREYRPDVEQAPVGVPRAPRPSVVQRVTQILDVFIGGPERLLLEEVAALTGLPRSTAFRIMSQLSDLQWLEHDAHGYRLGARAHGMGGRPREYGDLRAAAAGVLNDLHLATGAVAHLGVLEGGLLHYLDKVGGAALDTVPSQVDARVHADTTLMGRTLLATLPPEQVDTVLAVAAASRTGRPVDPERLHHQLHAVRRRHGLAFAHAASSPVGIAGVAAPIALPDGQSAAISLAGRDGFRPEAAAPLVVAAVRRVSDLLFSRARGAGRTAQLRPARMDEPAAARCSAS